MTLDVALLDGLVVRAGEDVQIQAMTDGKPVPGVTWSYKDKQLTQTDKIKIDRSITHAFLTIRGIGLVNGGEYVVTAANHYGSNSASCHVQVLGKS